MSKPEQNLFTGPVDLERRLLHCLLYDYDESFPDNRKLIFCLATGETNIDYADLPYNYNNGAVIRQRMNPNGRVFLESPPARYVSNSQSGNCSYLQRGGSRSYKIGLSGDNTRMQYFGGDRWDLSCNVGANLQDKEYVNCFYNRYPSFEEIKEKVNTTKFKTKPFHQHYALSNKGLLLARGHVIATLEDNNVLRLTKPGMPKLIREELSDITKCKIIHRGHERQVKKKEEPYNEQYDL